MSKSGTLKSIQPVTRIYGISERKKLNPILVEAKTKQGFLEWIKKTRRPCVYKRIESGEMSRKNLLKYLNQYEEYRTALEEKESLTKEISRLERAIVAAKNQLSKSKTKNLDLESRIKSLEQKLEETPKANQKDQKNLISKLQKDNFDLLERLEDLNSDYTNVKAESTRLNALVNTKQLKIDGQVKQLQDYQAAIENVKAESSKIQSEQSQLIRNYEEDVKQLTAANQELQRQSNSAQEEVDKLKGLSIFEFYESVQKSLSVSQDTNNEIRKLSAQVNKLSSLPSDLEEMFDEFIDQETYSDYVAEDTEEADSNFFTKIYEKYPSEDLALLNGQRAIIISGHRGAVENKLQNFGVDVKFVIIHKHKGIKGLQSLFEGNRNSFVFYTNLSMHTSGFVVKSKFKGKYTPIKLNVGDNADQIIASMVKILKQEQLEGSE